MSSNRDRILRIIERLREAADDYCTAPLMPERIVLTENHIHGHLRQRMLQRGIQVSEIELALNEGWGASDAKVGTIGKTMVFPYSSEWEGRFYE